jgi:hypothetical protein
MNAEITKGRSKPHVDGPEEPEWLKIVRVQLESLKFGTVQITVHDSRVVQIERVEKMRLDRPGS